MRAIVDRVDLRTCLRKLLRHQFVHRVHERFRKVTAADAGLIGDDDDRKARVVEPVNGSRDKGKQTKTADVIQVAHFLDDCAVAIEENGVA